MINRERLRAGLLSATILAGVMTAAPAMAQESATSGAEGSAAATNDGLVQSSNDIIVTATRRAVSLQDAPINISALAGESLEKNRLDDVTDIAAFTPGLTVGETGPRTANNIVMRGITSEGPGGLNRNTSVGVYLGEIPLYVDFKFLDINRVETLLGPQGTLYGLGTLAGAIRYIPNRPDFNKITVDGHLRYYDLAHSSGPGVVGDGTINLPIIPDKVALRVTAGYYNDPGFIDYPYLVRQLGVSNPQPNFNDPAAVAANLREGKDLNDEVTYAARVQLGFDFGWLRPTLSYIRQQTISNGSQSNGAFGARYENGPRGVQFPEGQCVYANCTGVLGTGKYESGRRVEEPSDRRVDLFALEVEADLGDIAQLVSATAYSKQELFSQGDIADLLLDLDYGYELFPNFAGYTRSENDIKQFNQEVRLVSTHGGPINWVIGGFYNKFDQYTFSAETLPGFPEFAAANVNLFLDAPESGINYTGLIRPDGLEYISFIDTTTKEQAVFGEATWHITPKFQVTGGVRYYKYKTSISGATDTPLTGGGRRRTPFPLVQFDPGRIRSAGSKFDGFVYKANASYEVNDQLFLYATYSTGYRIGGANRVAACTFAGPPAPPPPGQNVCALPDELLYGPDKTENFEVGLRFNLFDKMLSGTVDIYNVNWTDLQVSSQTFYGATGITTNASAARSRGVEATLAFKYDAFTLSGNYTYLDAKLTEDAPGLIGGISRAFDVDGVGDAFKGDRLPGTSKHAGSITGSYTLPMANDAGVTLLWSTQYRSNIFSLTGNRGYGQTIPGYSTSRAAITYSKPSWEFSIFANNVFDKYAVSSVANDFTLARQNDGVVIRSYGFGVIQPRQIGAEVRVHF